MVVHTSERSHEDEQQNEGSDERSSVRRGEQSQQRKGQGRKAHAKQLHAGAYEHTEEHRVGRRGAEHVSVNEFPATLLLGLLQSRWVIVLGDFLYMKVSLSAETIPPQ